MEGLFYYHHGLVEVNFLMFYRDGRVISGDNSTNFDQSSSQWFKADSYNVHYFRGTYSIGDRDKRTIRIVIKGDYGTLVYRGTILKNDAIKLTCRCPFTNYMKSATYIRYSEEQHIIHIKFSNICSN